MKNKNKLAVIALLLAWVVVVLFSLWILNYDGLMANYLLDKLLCPMPIPPSLDSPHAYAYPSCVWVFIGFIEFLFPLLLSIVVIILGFLSLKSEKKVVALLSIGIVTPILLFYLSLFFSIFFQ